MSRIHVYQVDAQSLLVANRSLLAAMLQDIVLDVAVAASVDGGFYRHAWTIETSCAGEEALEEAWFAAQDVVTRDARIAARAETARQSAKSDLFVVEGEGAWIAHGSWFSAYAGALPAGAPAIVGETRIEPLAAAG